MKILNYSNSNHPSQIRKLLWHLLINAFTTVRVTSNAFHANAGTQNAAQKEYIETWRDSRSNVPNRKRRKKRRNDAKTNTTACEKKLRKIEYDFPDARITISHEAWPLSLTS